MKGLKGQLSVFIILGILILIMVGINFYLMNDTSSLDISDYNPDSLTPVERFITLCLEDTTEDALLLLGQQGGYIYFDSPQAKAYYQNAQNYLSPLQGGIKVPIWDIRGNAILPTIDTMQTDIKRFVESNINDCVSLIDQQPSISNAQFKDEPVATVEITQEDVVVFLDYAIQVEFDNRVVEYENYASAVDVRLRKILETAEFLLYRHRTDLIVPDLAMNMISLDPDLPLGDIRFSCEPLFWSKRAVTSQLQEHLSYMIPQIRISGTDYQPFNEPLERYERIVSEWDSERVAAEGLPDYLPRDMYEYTQQFWQIPDYDFAGLQVGLLYDDSYGMDLQVNPSDGDRIESRPGRSGSSYLRYLCVNIYHFTYDVIFPFEVRLFDESAMDGQGFTFSYGLPAKIDHNYPTQGEPRFISMDATETNTQFCEDTRDENSYVLVWDGKTGEILNNVDITYDCTKYFCELGSTTTEYGTGVPELQTKVPNGCFNGFFIAEKDGYLRSKVQIENPDAVELTLLPLKEFNFALANKDTNIPLDDTIYNGMVFVKAQNHDFEQYAVYPPVETLPSKIQLLDVPETYDVEVMVFANDNFVGGYFGELDVTGVDLSSSSILFYPIIRPEMVQNANEAEVVSLFNELDDESAAYRQANYPVFR